MNAMHFFARLLDFFQKIVIRNCTRDFDRLCLEGDLVGFYAFMTQYSAAGCAPALGSVTFRFLEEAFYGTRATATVHLVQSVNDEDCLLMYSVYLDVQLVSLLNRVLQ